MRRKRAAGGDFLPLPRRKGSNQSMEGAIFADQFASFSPHLFAKSYAEYSCESKGWANTALTSTLHLATMKKNEERIDNQKNKKKKHIMMKKNISRLGGGGLSLDAFASAKSNNNHYNPALIKKQREFYKNAKNVNKFKKLLKQQNQQNDPSLAQRLIENVNETKEYKDKSAKTKKNSARSLEELYKKQHEEKERERMEREAVQRIKKEEREQAEARRKAMREKMLKKTRKGQPVMKYRIEHLLETIQGSTKNTDGSKS
ncbi:hypothetical protein VNO78_18006 [Psophocarpus tetragonolobus]|uniref:rRNA-processing protein FYV7 n=1 Tax=Psophocarpus tetragonolobus TaxID=3891 RepID=A0AAN9SIJ8_PSOTE